MANLTKDENKIKVVQFMDSHCFHCGRYFRDEVSELMGEQADDSVEFNKRFKAATSTNSRLAELRQMSKPVSFSLAFGAHGQKVADTLKAPLSEGDRLYDIFHHVLYPGITAHNNEVIMKEVNKTGEVYLGLGLSCKTSEPRKYERTIKNIYVQFWDLISIITVRQIQDKIDEAGLQDDIQVTSTIYDSLYFNCRDDLNIIKWLNDNVVPILTQTLFTDQVVPNSAKGQVGTNWANLKDISNDASIEEIQQVLDRVR